MNLHVGRLLYMKTMHLRYIIVDYLHVMQKLSQGNASYITYAMSRHNVVSYRKIPWFPHIGKLSSTNLGIMIMISIGPSILIYQETELWYAIYVHL